MNARKLLPHEENMQTKSLVLTDVINKNAKAIIPAPFTQDETIVRKFDNTTYIINVKYKQGAKEGFMDKLLRIIENDGELYKGLE